MKKPIFIIDSNNFETLEGFYDEVQSVLTNNFTEFGRNLDAFSDILEGGFGKFEYGEPIKIMWKNAHKSRLDLGFPETIKYFKIKLKRCHPTNRTLVLEELRNAQDHKGETIFDILVNIVYEHEHIEFHLEE